MTFLTSTIASVATELSSLEKHVTAEVRGDVPQIPAVIQKPVNFETVLTAILPLMVAAPMNVVLPIVVSCAEKAQQIAIPRSAAMEVQANVPSTNRTAMMAQALMMTTEEVGLRTTVQLLLQRPLQLAVSLSSSYFAAFSRALGRRARQEDRRNQSFVVEVSATGRIHRPLIRLRVFLRCRLHLGWHIDMHSFGTGSFGDWRFDRLDMLRVYDEMESLRLLISLLGNRVKTAKCRIWPEPRGHLAMEHVLTSR
jgi:hypothetical protein